MTKQTALLQPNKLSIMLASSLGVMAAYAPASFAHDSAEHLFLAELSQQTQASQYEISNVQSDPENEQIVKQAKEAPFAETRFMQHVGSVELLFGLTQYSSTSGNSNSFVVGDGFSYANKQQPLLLGSRASDLYDPIDTRYGLTDEENLESDIYSLGLGMFVKQGLMVGFKYDRTTSKVYRDLAQINTYKSDQYDLFTKYVHNLRDGKAVNVEASYAIDTAIDNDRGDNYTLNISGDYYLSQQHSIGLGFERITSEEDVVNGNVVSVELRSFITPKFSVAAGLEQYSSENALYTDDTTIDINFNARF